LSSVSAFDSYLELDSEITPSFLEVESNADNSNSKYPGIEISPPISMNMDDMRLNNINLKNIPQSDFSVVGGENNELLNAEVNYAVNSMDTIPSNVQVEQENDGLPNVIDAVHLADDSMSLLEVENKQLYFDQTAAGIIGSTRQSTRVQRQLERQKYNEIYRVVDISLDDVCEQGMPNSFYGFCKQIYKVQSDVVDGLRYQYRPSDICFRIGMCPKGSYITKGIHSRYK